MVTLPNFTQFPIFRVVKLAILTYPTKHPFVVHCKVIHICHPDARWWFVFVLNYVGHANGSLGVFAEPEACWT